MSILYYDIFDAILCISFMFFYHKKDNGTADRINLSNTGNVNVKSKISFTPHIFRHTYATNLYYAGIDIKSAQYLPGHSSLDMTLRIYTHLDSKRSNNMAREKIKNFFSQSNVILRGIFEVDLSKIAKSGSKPKALLKRACNRIADEERAFLQKRRNSGLQRIPIFVKKLLIEAPPAGVGIR